MTEMMHMERRDISYDDFLNELMNVYQDSLRFSGENAGG
jgi:hypothetical protein